MPCQLLVSIYNSAGELVKTVFEGVAQEIPRQVQLSTPALAIGQGSATLALPGLAFSGNAPTWDGSNNNGQYVSGGVYYWKVESRDSYGHVTTLIQAMTVVDALPSNSLEIFNSAGEVVASIPVGTYPGGITDFFLEDSRFAEVFDPATGAPAKHLKVTLKDSTGAAHDYYWDGLNNQGRPLDSGNYTVRLVSQGQGQNVVASQSLVVIRGISPNPLDKAFLAPNPALAGTPQVMFYFTPMSAGRMRLRLYNLAGEAVAGAEADAGSGIVKIETAALATGVYMAAAESWDQGFLKARKVFKFAVIH
jgi:flagellar hook assembly protein FlgD